MKASLRGKFIEIGVNINNEIQDMCWLVWSHLRRPIFNLENAPNKVSCRQACEVFLD